MKIKHTAIQLLKTRQLWYVETFAAPDPIDFTIADGFWYQNTQVERQQIPLGDNMTMLIYDLWQGFHPDSFAALCGCVIGGGSIMLLGPPLAQLHLFQDPSYNTMSTWPKICPLDTHYLARLQVSLQVLIKQDHCQRCKAQDHGQLQNLLTQVTSTLNPAHTCSPEPLRPTIEQNRFIDAILQALQQLNPANSQPWYSLFANRGFGKTACLGLVIKHIFEQQRTPLIMTYVTRHKTQRQSFVAQFTHLLNRSSCLQLTATSLEGLEHQRHAVPWLIMIDECATNNKQQLERTLQMLNAHTAIVILASSIDGYEGSAKHLLQIKTPRPLLQQHLTQPLRWPAHDPVARWMQDFFYVATPTASTQHLSSAKILQPFDQSQLTIQQVDVKFLLQHNRLQAWVELMNLAHYRTRPSDVRLMLDAPHQRFIVMMLNSKLIGGLWLSHEGPIPDHFIRDITQGRRRIKGHLAPQYAFNHGILHGLTHAWVRIVRIAINPDYQRQSLGTVLVQYCIEQHCSEQSPTDTLAVSFQPSVRLDNFWHRNNFAKLTDSFCIYRKAPAVDYERLID